MATSGTGAIATRANCNSLVSGAYTAELTKCVTYSSVMGTGKFNVTLPSGWTANPQTNKCWQYANIQARVTTSITINPTSISLSSFSGTPYAKTVTVSWSSNATGFTMSTPPTWIYTSKSNNSVTIWATSANNTTSARAGHIIFTTQGASPHASATLTITQYASASPTSSAGMKIWGINSIGGTMVAEGYVTYNADPSSQYAPADRKLITSSSIYNTYTTFADSGKYAGGTISTSTFNQMQVKFEIYLRATSGTYDVWGTTGGSSYSYAWQNKTTRLYSGTFSGNGGTITIDYKKATDFTRWDAFTVGQAGIIIAKMT